MSFPRSPSAYSILGILYGSLAGVSSACILVHSGVRLMVGCPSRPATSIDRHLPSYESASVSMVLAAVSSIVHVVRTSLWDPLLSLSCIAYELGSRAISSLQDTVYPPWIVFPFWARSSHGMSRCETEVLNAAYVAIFSCIEIKETGVATPFNFTQRC